MKNEERYVRSRLGNENRFRVPEGYFDTLADRIISQLPERDGHEVVPEYYAVSGHHALSIRLRPWLYAAAACVVGVVSLVTVYLNTAGQPAEKQMASAVGTETYLDEAVDYVMADNQDIYACLLSDL